MNKADELRREIDISLKNASAADTVGRYDWAAYFEDRAQKMMEELKIEQLQKGEKENAGRGNS